MSRSWLSMKGAALLLLAAVLTAASHAGRSPLATLAPVALSAESTKGGSLASAPPLRVVSSSLHLRGGFIPMGPNTMDMLSKMVELAPKLPEEQPGPHAEEERAPPKSGERDPTHSPPSGA